MAGLLNKFLDYIGIEETDEEDEYMEDLYEEDSRDADNVVSIGNRGRSKTAAANGNVVNLPSAAQQKMIVYHPISYEDTQNIIDNLKGRKPVIVNMEQIEVETAQRRRRPPAGQRAGLGGRLQDSGPH